MRPAPGRVATVLDLLRILGNPKMQGLIDCFGASDVIARPVNPEVQKGNERQAYSVFEFWLEESLPHEFGVELNLCVLVEASRDSSNEFSDPA